MEVFYDDPDVLYISTHQVRKCGLRCSRTLPLRSMLV